MKYPSSSDECGGHGRSEHFYFSIQWGSCFFSFTIFHSPFKYSAREGVEFIDFHVKEHGGISFSNVLVNARS